MAQKGRRAEVLAKLEVRAFFEHYARFLLSEGGVADWARRGEGDRAAIMDSSAWLLVSDIDDTLTGDERALGELLKLVEAGKFRLVFNSSRPRESVRGTLAEFPGVAPGSMITAMGTEMMVDGEIVMGWEERFAGWERALVEDVVLPLGGVPHAAEYQTRYKASFAVEGAERQSAVREAILASGQEARVIISGQSDVDVMPVGAGKGEATLYLAEFLGVDVAQQLLVAGDSGNDLAMFEDCPRGILVGNARRELREAARPESSYQASAHHAAGVLEGLRYWEVLQSENNPSNEQ